MKYLSVCSGIEAASAVLLPEGVTAKARVRDVTGIRFGRLVPVRVVGKAPSGSLIWECACDCGKTVSRTSASLQKAKGMCSCGCYLKEVSKERLRHKSPWNKGKSYQTRGDDALFTSKKAWSEAARKKYGNKCGRCGWDKATCDVHHIIPRSKGGKNTMNNAEVICPNCHRIHHEVR